MDKIKDYQKYLKEILKEYAEIFPTDDANKTLCISDDAQGIYMLMRVGWNKNYRVHSTMFHADIIGDKIWIQDDWTDYSIAKELTDRGVPESNIVLAFQPKEIRETMSFAVQ